MAAVEQVAYGRAGRRDVVDGDVVVRGLVLALPQQDQGRGLAARHEVLGLQVDRAEDDAVDHMRAEPLADQELVLAQAGGVIDQHGVVVPGRRVDDRAGQFGEVRVAELGYGQGDDAGAPLAQMARGEIGPVAEFVDGPLHLGPHLGVTC